MYCPNCKQYNEGVYCPECGAKLVEAPECDEVVARESYCPNCKQHFEGIYCPECGAKLIETPECDEASSVKRILKAAEQGDASAQTKVGMCYYCGIDVEQNETEAAKWFLKAAEQGSDEAVKNLKKLGY